MRRTTCRALSIIALPFAALAACAPHIEAAPEPRPVDGGRAVVLVPPDASFLDAAPDPTSALPPREPTAPAASPSLLALGAGNLVVAVDPDRDRIYVADLDASRIVRVIDLPRGVEPGRLVEDGRGRVHVVLRRGGGIATIEPGASVATLRPTCAAPRGIAFRASDDSLVVACAEGLVVVLPAAGGPATRVLSLDDDLRDVVILGDDLLVSRFRSAEVLRIDRAGAIVARYRPATVTRPDALARPLDPADTTMATFEPEVAWRMIPAGAGAWLLHQRARVTPISATADGVSYGEPALDPSRDCSFGLVESAVSTIGPDQPSGALAPSQPLTTVLATDVTFRPSAPRFRSDDWLGAPPLLDDGTCATLPSDTVVRGAGAVTYSARHGVVRLTGHPLTISWSTRSHLALAGEIDWTGGELARSIFETVQPSRIACASCHPEGGEDGHVWAQGAGLALRTQSVQGGILSTAPFHWAGDMPDFDTLMTEVLVGRMHGAALHPTKGDLFASWIDALDPPPRPIADVDAITRGRALFESDERGCSSCHGGPRYSTGETVDVGTGGLFQVPALVGVAYRAPYLHGGCATTLRERFTGPAACTGGDLHGHTSDLSEPEIDDLVAYMRSL